MAGGASQRSGQLRALGFKYRLAMLEAHFAAVEAWQRQNLARVQDLRARLADGTRQIDDFIGERPGRLGYDRIAEGDYRGSPATRRRRDARDAVTARRDDDHNTDNDEDEDEEDREGREEPRRDEQRAESATATRRATTRPRKART